MVDFSLKDYALFEPGCRHVAKDIMGQNRANPAAMILSATMMLRHLGSVILIS
jgi:isocitrate dehydrogenase (NAD+)